MDILDLIRKDHRQIENLFSEIERTGNTQKLYGYFNQLYEEISLHTEVEEKIFYPAISNYQNTERLVDEAQKEHNEIKQMLEDIESFSPISDEFKQKLSELKQAVKHHIQEEENEVFNQVQEWMSKPEREQLGNEFEAVKSQQQSE